MRRAARRAPSSIRLVYFADARHAAPPETDRSPLMSSLQQILETLIRRVQSSALSDHQPKFVSKRSPEQRHAAVVAFTTRSAPFVLSLGIPMMLLASFAVLIMVCPIIPIYQTFWCPFSGHRRLTRKPPGDVPFFHQSVVVLFLL